MQVLVPRLLLRSSSEKNAMPALLADAEETEGQAMTPDERPDTRLRKSVAAREELYGADHIGPSWTETRQWIATIDSLRQQLAEAQKHWPGCVMYSWPHGPRCVEHTQKQYRQIAELQKERDEMRAYTDHKLSCPAYLFFQLVRRSGPCTCGLAELLTRTNRTEG